MIGIIYYAYGAPKSLDDVTPYFSHILNGKTPPPQMIEKITAQFKKLGGVDPLAANTSRIAKGLEHALQQRLTQTVKVYNAYKHTEPYISQVVNTILEDGITTFITLPVNPIMSLSGAGAFYDEVSALLASHDVTVIHAKGWHLHSELLAVYKDRIQRAYEWIPAGKRAQTHVLYTVHSQPIDPERNEIYVRQFSELSEAISKATQIDNWHITYRSGHGKVDWLGPDVKDMIYTLNAEGAQGFVTCELLSLSADIESYFEIGSDCQRICEELQVDFAQAEFPGDSYDTIQALAAIVESFIPAE
ncbi:ferrochelatase [Lysinibacillus xylanilyticus]|uniref:ferrochelatase n=1 Tax=Lysinibacillus xylanilyticus TaxID=582475 RepID=UPI002B245342|nr:ferrochelatase [Lysinibacillus xylanilyticus]MEB2281672.1 ferrochelatase [Lysinibacillus xylanilyticus]